VSAAPSTGYAAAQGDTASSRPASALRGVFLTQTPLAASAYQQLPAPGWQPAPVHQPQQYAQPPQPQWQQQQQTWSPPDPSTHTPYSGWQQPLPASLPAAPSPYTQQRQHPPSAGPYSSGTSAGRGFTFQPPPGGCWPLVHHSRASCTGTALPVAPQALQNSHAWLPGFLLPLCRADSQHSARGRAAAASGAKPRWRCLCAQTQARCPPITPGSATPAREARPCWQQRRSAAVAGRRLGSRQCRSAASGKGSAGGQWAGGGGPSCPWQAAAAGRQQAQGRRQGSSRTVSTQHELDL
jgi:hypothetical protein